LARKLVVELIADPRGYTAGLQTAAKQTKLFGAEMDKATRGILTGTGALHGLGRSLAFASGGFLAFEGVSRFLEDSVSSARDAGVAQRSLAAQVKAAGDSFTGNQAAITKAELSLEKFGFTSEDSAKALTVLERGTGNITKAIGLQSTAADLARAKNIDLASAANVLAKVFGGQETALRRAVPGLEKNAHGLDLITLAQQRLAGQAKAGTTEAERFHAILHDTEVIIGTALLPTLNKFLTSLGDWLQKMNESGRLQKDVNEVVKTGTGIFEGVLAVVKPLASAFKTLGDMVGGTKDEVKLLAAAFAAFKVSKLIGGLATVGSTAATSAGEVTALRGALSRLAGIGLITIPIEILLNRGQIDKAVSGFLDSHGLGFLGGTNRTTANDPRLAGTFPGLYRPAGGAAGLAGPLGAPTRPALTGPVGAPSVNVPGRVAGAAFQNPALSAAQARAIGLAGDPNNLALLRAQAAHDQAALAFAEKLRASGRISNAKYVAEVTAYSSDLQQTNSTVASILEAARQKTADDAAAAAEKTKAAADAAKQRAAQAQQNLFDRLQFKVDKAGLTDTLSDDLKALQTYQAVLKNIISTQGSTLALQQQLLGVETNIKSVQDQIASNRQQQIDAHKAAVKAAQEAAKQAAAEAKAAREAAAQRRKQAAEAAAQAAAARRDRIQFSQLGLGPTGGALVPGVANLQTRLAGLRSAVQGTFLDTDKTGTELDRIGNILAGKFGKVSQGVRSAIDQMYKDIRDKLKSHQGDQTKFRHLSSTAFVDSLGLNLTGAQRRAIEARFTTVGRGGTVPGGTSHQFTGGAVIHIEHFHSSASNAAALENELTKRAKARAHTRRGT
jgi:hypothetical protein